MLDQGSNFYNGSMKSWLHYNVIKIYLTHTTRNKGKSVVAERFIKTFKTKIYKYMMVFSKNVNLNNLDGLLDKYNNTYHKKIKMKPADVKIDT